MKMGMTAQFEPLVIPATRPGMGALIRQLHHCHIVNIRGNSYRMRHHTELHKALQQRVEEPSQEAATN